MEDSDLAAARDEKLNALFAHALKEAYVALRNRLRPGIGRAANVQDAQWLPVAAALRAHGADPCDFVRYCFDLYTDRHSDVYANMVASLNAVAGYINDAPELESQLKLALEIQARELSECLLSGEAIEDIFGCSNHFSAVFRFAAAHNAGKPELAALYREDAERMLIFKPAYKRLLAHWLPKEMLEC
jgi:hypothetical protein